MHLPYAQLAAAVDLIHALAMVVFVAGVPVILFSRARWVNRYLVPFAVSFIVLSLLSEWWLHECFLTTVARYLRSQSEGAPVHAEWFTVRMAETVFHLRPSQALIRWLGKGLFLLYLTGIWRQRRTRHRSLRAATSRTGDAVPRRPQSGARAPKQAA